MKNAVNSVPNAHLPSVRLYMYITGAYANQPTFCGMLGEFGAPPTSYFSSREYQQPYFIVNSRNTAWKNLTLHVNLLSSDGKGQKLVDYRIPSLAAWEKKEGTVALTFPGNLRPGNYQMRLLLTCGKKEVCRNFYDVFVQDQSVTTKKISTKGRIAMLAPGTEQIGDIRKVFSDLGIKKDELTDLSLLSNYDVLVVPPAKSRHPLLATKQNRDALLRWVSDGGTLLSLEQNYADKICLGGKLTAEFNTFVDLVVPNHPVFAGLAPENFDIWANPDMRHTISFCTKPITVNVLAANGPRCGTSGVYNAVAEGAYGKGRILASQLCATSLWNTDSVASTYMHNLLAYTMGGQMLQNVRPWVDATISD